MLNTITERCFHHLLFSIVLYSSYNWKKVVDCFICIRLYLIYIKIKHISLSLCCAYFAGNLDLGKKDIIFLIDGSDNTGTAGIAHIRDFILNIVKQLNVQPDQVRVGVVQYADRVKTEFSLITHNNKPAVVSAIQRLRQIGGRSSNLADAIEYVMQNELKPAAGVRLADASQHLVVLTGGRSPQDVSIYGPLLKGARVNCIGVGTAGAEKRQLTQIATTKDDVLEVSDFPGLPTIRQGVIDRLSGTIPVETPTDPCKLL